MTWNVVLELGPEHTVALGPVSQAAYDALDLQGVEPSTEAMEQVTAACTAACDLIASGALGRSDHWQIAMSGHDNPGHADREGYAHDSVTVSVSRRIEGPPPTDQVIDGEVGWMGARG